MISYSSSTSPEENEVLIDKLYTLNLDKQLGRGGFGHVYLGQNIQTHNQVSIKVEPSSSRSHLQIEYEILSCLKGGVGIPQPYKFIKKRDKNYFVMELLGRSLDKLFTLCKKKFSLKTILLIAYQMVERIEYVHSKGFIHRDIKPGNFLIGNKNKNIIYIIDFGLSKRYKDKTTGEHVAYREGKGLTGTARYASLFTHMGIEQSRRDDIEGIAYNLIFLSKGKLPWQGVRAKTKKEKHKIIMDKKTSMTPEELCKGLPEEFVILLKYARNLGFDEKPDYKNMKLIFANLLTQNGFKNDNIYDWDALDLEKEEFFLNELKKKK